MIVTIALPVLAIGGSVVAVWTKRVGAGYALLLFVAGFELAGTGAADPFNHLLTALVDAVNHH
ncbi:hypothetical protein ACFW1A_10040 [Kitasatospora sp. NPDC058965]|uniref:hypothetical protein n=1 Tax=Kitasatospora sp. NPDC058965 TaxID=3346682 RepID=UPI00367920F4